MGLSDGMSAGRGGCWTRWGDSGCGLCSICGGEDAVGGSMNHGVEPVAEEDDEDPEGKLDERARRGRSEANRQTRRRAQSRNACIFPV